MLGLDGAGMTSNDVPLQLGRCVTVTYSAILDKWKLGTAVTKFQITDEMAQEWGANYIGAFLLFKIIMYYYYNQCITSIFFCR